MAVTVSGGAYNNFCQVYITALNFPSIQEDGQEVLSIQQEECLMDPYIFYIKKEIVSEDKNEVQSSK